MLREHNEINLFALQFAKEPQIGKENGLKSSPVDLCFLVNFHCNDNSSCYISVKFNSIFLKNCHILHPFKYPVFYRLV